MSNPLPEDYFDFLVDELDPRSWEVCSVLHGIEWRSPIPMDRNREEDAVFFRTAYLDREGVAPSRVWQTTRVSVLEVLVALANRAVMADSRDVSSVELIMKDILNNSGLGVYLGQALTDDDVEEIRTIVRHILDREYDYDGTGGWFPLSNPPRDQRGEELWYQMQAYFVENTEG